MDVQGASWSSEGHLGAQVDPKRRPRRSKLSPTGTQDAPSWAQEAPKRLQVEPKRRPRRPKLCPRGVQAVQVGPKRRPRDSKLGSRVVQEVQVEATNVENCIPGPLDMQKARTSNFDDPTTLFEGLERCGRAAEGQVGAHFGCAESKLEL